MPADPDFVFLFSFLSFILFIFIFIIILVLLTILILTPLSGRGRSMMASQRLGPTVPAPFSPARRGNPS
jgi:hypothetical protein